MPDAIPFESQYQYMATLHEADPQTIYVKGSLEAILSRCTQMLNQQGQPVSIDQEKIEQAVEAMTAKALRVLAFAKKPVAAHQHSIDHDDLNTELVFLGVQGMIDPPRPEAIAAIHACQTAAFRSK